jgi:hypothetical protein
VATQSEAKYRLLRRLLDLQEFGSLETALHGTRAEFRKKMRFSRVAGSCLAFGDIHFFVSTFCPLGDPSLQEPINFRDIL